MLRFAALLFVVLGFDLLRFAARSLFLRLAVLCRWLVSRQLFYRQPIQWTGGRDQVFPAAMQIDHRRDKTRVTEQFADRQQVHARFEKSGRVGVTKRVG